jgi:rod shape-determining protein MreD
MRMPSHVVATPLDPASIAIEVLRLTALMFVAVLLQTMVAPNVRILGANPDFVLIMVVCVALLRGAEIGALFGFIAGGLVAVVLFEPAGISSFVLVVVGYMAGRFAETADLSPGVAPLVTVLAASLIGETIYSVAQFLLDRQAPFYFVTTRVIVPVVVLDTLLAAPVYLVVHWWLRGERHAGVSETR